ncbi:hypothetical protein DIPPA_15518 [Diplonema papillatum]|nr:hypothetical protein DIPPA_17336 [Diplonema papillatum]KAJ9457335.1 hypothetical protein DIPPA_15518 [Diplonema papillatum]
MVGVEEASPSERRTRRAKRGGGTARRRPPTPPTTEYSETRSRRRRRKEDAATGYPPAPSPRSREADARLGGASGPPGYHPALRSSASVPASRAQQQLTYVR